MTAHGGDAEANGAKNIAIIFFHGQGQLILALAQLAHLLYKLNACGSKLNMLAALLTLHQPHAIIILQLSDLTAQGRLHDIQFASGGAHGVGLGQHEEVAVKNQIPFYFSLFLLNNRFFLRFTLL